MISLKPNNEGKAIHVFISPGEEITRPLIIYHA